ncbi:MAG: hypothetical protein KJ864_04555 [Candidatus Omnitrophica bacterium]|nr:hypothetical protein [Candidatus Omnitrophota bacterium]
MSIIKNIAMMCLFSALVSPCLYAQEEQKEEIPAGMEVVYIGNTKSVVPAGTKVHKSKGFMILESTPEYVGRRFKEHHEKLGSIQKEKDLLENEVQKLKEELANKTQEIDKIQKDIRRNTNKIKNLEEEIWGH